MTDTSRLNGLLERSRAAAETELPALAAVYENALKTLAADASRTFATLTAATWQPQPEGSLLRAIDALAVSVAVTQHRIQARILKLVVRDPLDRLGIAWNVKHPLSQDLLARAGGRVGTRLGAAATPILRDTIANAYEQGLSVPDTAALIRTNLTAAAPWQAEMLARTDLNGLANGGSTIAAQLAGASYKIWEATLDDRTRPEHMDAHGQTVPVAHAFTVGGEQLDYPGDPSGSDAMVANCRCTVTYGDTLQASASPRAPMAHLSSRVTMAESLADTGTDALVAATLGQTKWLSDLAFEGEATSDGRYMLPRSLKARELPLTLMAQTVTDDGHDGAFVAGRIDTISRRSVNIDGDALPEGVMSMKGTGIFDMGGANGADIARLVDEQILRGVSVDLGILAWCFRDPATADLIEPEDMTDDQWERAFFGELQYAVKSAEILAATVCPTPAFANARIALAASAGTVGTLRLWAPLRVVTPGDGILGRCTCGENRAPIAGDRSANTVAAGTARRATKSAGSPERCPIHGAPNVASASRADEVAESSASATPASRRAADGSLASGTRNSTKLRSRPAARTAKPRSKSGLQPREGDAFSAQRTSAAIRASASSGTNSKRSWTPKVIGALSAASRSRMSQAEGRHAMPISIIAPDLTNFADGFAAPVTEGLAASSTTRSGSTARRRISGSLAPIAPPSEWFLAKEADGPCPLTVAADGQVFGHIALWETCHTGFPDACIRPPRSPSGYAFFHVGTLETADGEPIHVGKLMIGGKHAPLSMTQYDAAQHYDNNGMVGAYVRATDGRYGIWVAGALRHDLTPEQLRDFRANPPSGDWRPVNGQLDLVAALAVPVPGYPVAHAELGMVASGGGVQVAALIATSGHIDPSAAVIRSLVASGLVTEVEEGCDECDGDTEARIRALVARAEGGIDGLLALATGKDV